MNNDSKKKKIIRKLHYLSCLMPCIALFFEFPKFEIFLFYILLISYHNIIKISYRRPGQIDTKIG